MYSAEVQSSVNHFEVMGFTTGDFVSGVSYLIP